MWNPDAGPVHALRRRACRCCRRSTIGCVIMGSGDELRLLLPGRGAAAAAARLDARLPAAGRRLGQGRRRQHRVFADRRAAAVPRHERISVPGAERFPDDPEHREYRERYNTRPALRLLRPLTTPQPGGTPDEPDAFAQSVPLARASSSCSSTPATSPRSRRRRSSTWGTCCCTSCSGWRWRSAWRRAAAARDPELRRALASGRRSCSRCRSRFGALPAGGRQPTEHRWVLRAHIVTAGLGVVALIPFVVRSSRAAPAAAQRSAWATPRATAFAVLLPVAAIGYVDGPSEPARTASSTRSSRPTSMHEEGGGPEVAVLPLVGEDQRRRHHPVELLHGLGSAAASATRTSTSSGTARRTTSRRSTTSSTGSRSSTCRTWSARSRASGAPAATTTRCSSTAGSSGRSRSRSTRRRRTRASPARRATRSPTSTARMGNGGFTIEYPPLHELATSKQPVHPADRHVPDLPESGAAPAHVHEAVHARRLAEFCSACHKVHLDVPVNDYRWFRGFNDYDNWQASGVSGQGARSFYYPKESKTCTDCHMPLVKSNDPGSTRTARSIRTASPRPTRRCPSSTTTRSR